MTNLECYEAELPSIHALAKERIEQPSIPMDAYLIEGEGVRAALKKHQHLYVARGYKLKMSALLERQIGATREAQSRLIVFRNKDEAAQTEWAENSTIAFNLRNKLLKEMKFACRKNTKKLQTLKEISKGASIGDMLLDLATLSTLGKEIIPELEAIVFDMTLLTEAANLSNELGLTMKEAEQDRSTNSEIKEIRDRAFTLLNQTIVEIRDWADFTFDHGSAELEMYSSKYRRAKYNKTKKAKAESEAANNTPEEPEPES